ncbi:MAG: M20/M25/M40 family metallo-hydrolase, partial [Acidobacteriota bacterium]
AEQFIDTVRKAVDDPTIHIKVIYESGGTPVTPWTSRMFTTIENVVRRHHPGAIVTPSPIPYGTDSNTFRLRGAEAYGFFPVVLDLGVVSSMHGDAERLPVEAFREGIQVFTDILRDFAGGDGGP